MSVYKTTISALLGKTQNEYHAKCMHFSKVQLVSNCYTVNLYELISKLYMYKNQSYIFPTAGLCFFCFFFFIFRKIQEYFKLTAKGLIRRSGCVSSKVYFCFALQFKSLVWHADIYLIHGHFFYVLFRNTIILYPKLSWHVIKDICGGGWVRQRCRVSYVIGASNWYWLTVGQGLLSM